MVLQHLKSRTADEVPLAVLAMPCFGKSFFFLSGKPFQDYVNCGFRAIGPNGGHTSAGQSHPLQKVVLMDERPDIQFKFGMLTREKSFDPTIYIYSNIV